MFFQRIISRLPQRSQVSNGLFSGASKNLMPRFSGISSLRFSSFIPSNGPKAINDEPTETQNNSGFFKGLFGEGGFRESQPFNERNSGRFEGFTPRFSNNRTPIETRPTFSESNRPNFGRDSRSMNFARGIMRNGNGNGNGIPNYQSTVEHSADIVHVKIMKNNVFVTVTDSKGNKKTGSSAGSLAEMKGGPKVSRYSAEATAEHVGRVAKSMGIKSVVMKVNGFTHFKKKKLAVLSFRDGYTNSRSDQNPIVYVEDTTRKPHNGCRLKKQRRF